MNRLAVVLTLPALAAAAGCKKSVKTAEVEGFIKTRTAELGINASKVICPKKIEAKEGSSFDCQLEVEGKTYTLTGTIKQVGEDQVQYGTSWKDGPNGVIIRAKFVPALEQELGKEFGAKLTVTCSEPLLFLDANRSTTCEISSGAAKAKVAVTFDDKLVPTGWKLDPPLLAKAKLEQVLTPSVQGKVGASATVDCGSEALIARPADGKIYCKGTANEAGKASEAKLLVEVDEQLNVKRWEAVTP